MLNSSHNARAKSRSRSIFIASPTGEKIGVFSSVAHGSLCQSMDMGIITSGFHFRIMGIGEG